jgi:hypothetical protein
VPLIKGKTSEKFEKVKSICGAIKSTLFKEWFLSFLMPF